MLIGEIMTPKEFRALLDSAESNASSNAEMDFVQDTTDKFEQYGLRTKLTDKQLAWLRQIAGE